MRVNKDIKDVSLLDNQLIKIMKNLYNSLSTIFMILVVCEISYAQSKLDINVIGQPIVGETVTIEVTGMVEEGVRKIWLIQDNNALDKTEMNCSGLPSCTLEKEIEVFYPGIVRFEAILFKSPNTYLRDTSIYVDFTCQSEYCEPGPILENFFQWMREVDYDECLIERYYSYLLIPELRTEMKSYLRDSTITYDHGDTVIFYDIIPTDLDATFIGMDTDEAPDCEGQSGIPGFCENPTSADYNFVRDHWERTFGIDFVFRYERVEFSYLEEFGEPTWDSANNYWIFNIPTPFLVINTEPHNLAHFALETWKGAPVRQVNGGAWSSLLFFEPINPFQMTVYTHEWGHSQALGHTFIDIDGERTFFSTDGIMTNTYMQNTYADGLDPLDPIERYLFEPSEGFLDQETFAERYSEGIVSSWQFNNICSDIDPAVTSLSLDHVTNENYIFKAVLNNLGSINAAFIDVSLYQKDLETPPLSERTYECIKPNVPIEIYFTIGKEAVDDDLIIIKVDANEAISDEDENNNVLILDKSTNVHYLDDSVSDIFIYPNPSTEHIDISFPAHFGNSYTIKIYSSDGLLFGEYKNKSRIDISEANRGIYYIEIINGKSGNKIIQNLVKI